MDQLKVCFVGIGSIAKRHIRNLRSICNDRGISLTIDALRRNLKQVDGVDRIYTSVAELSIDYDVIFITNPTDLHLETLKVLQEHGKHFFIEKPVVTIEQINEAKQFSLKPNSVYYVAAPLRYNAIIQWVKDNVDLADVISVRAISSSYLPDWRPGQDYRQTYSAHKDMGGGVSIDLIHEWDYLTYLFGWPERVLGMIGKKSSLEIDSDDYAIYIAEYENMIAELHLDYFGRKSIREIEIFMKEDTIIGDIVGNKINYLKSGESISFKEKRDDYQKKELNYFLDMIIGEVDKENGFQHGIEVLELTKGRKYQKK